MGVAAGLEAPRRLRFAIAPRVAVFLLQALIYREIRVENRKTGFGDTYHIFVIICLYLYKYTTFIPQAGTPVPQPGGPVLASYAEST